MFSQSLDGQVVNGDDLVELLRGHSAALASDHQGARLRRSALLRSEDDLLFEEHRVQVRFGVALIEDYQFKSPVATLFAQACPELSHESISVYRSAELHRLDAEVAREDLVQGMLLDAIDSVELLPREQNCGLVAAQLLLLQRRAEREFDGVDGKD